MCPRVPFTPPGRSGLGLTSPRWGREHRTRHSILLSPTRIAAGLSGHGLTYGTAIRYLATLVVICFTAAADVARADEPPFEHDVQPLLAKYCYQCHNAEKKETELDLTPIRTTADAAATQVWEGVLDRIRAGEMPPAKAPQPNDDERKLLVGWLDRTVNVDCSQLTDEQRRRYYRNYVMSRRLTRCRIRQFDPRSCRPRSETEQPAAQRRRRRRRF